MEAKGPAMEGHSKLFLRSVNPAVVSGKEKVLKCLTIDIGVPVIGLRQVATGFNAIFERKEDADRVLEVKSIEHLERIGLSVRIPPELRARRSIFCRRIDSYVGEHTPQQLKTELEKENKWMKVREVIKFKDYTHVFKIEMTTVNAADRAIRDGFGCFYTRVTPDQVEREKYVNLLICFSCYKYEHHTSDKCPERDNKVCSECAASGHTFRDCKSEVKKCLNCGGPHRTMAMACRVKKEEMRKKMEELENKAKSVTNKTYAEVAKAVVKEVEATKPAVPSALKINEGTQAEIVVMIIHAHIHNFISGGGTYKNELNRLLAGRGIAPMDFPENPPSENLMGVQVDQNLRTQQKEIQRVKERQQQQEQQQQQQQHQQQQQQRQQQQEQQQQQNQQQQQQRQQQQQQVQQQQTVAENKRSRKDKTGETMEVEAQSKQRLDSHVEEVKEKPRQRGDSKTRDIVAAREANIQIIVEEEEGADEDDRVDLDPGALKQLFQTGKLKFKLPHNSTYDVDTIARYIHRQKIRENKVDITYVTPDIFRKVRTGDERTPPHQQQHDLRRGDESN